MCSRSTRTGQGPARRQPSGRRTSGWVERNCAMRAPPAGCGTPRSTTGSRVRARDIDKDIGGTKAASARRRPTSTACGSASRAPTGTRGRRGRTCWASRQHRLPGCYRLPGEARWLGERPRRLPQQACADLPDRPGWRRVDGGVDEHGAHRRVHGALLRHADLRMRNRCQAVVPGTACTSAGCLPLVRVALDDRLRGRAVPMAGCCLTYTTSHWPGLPGPPSGRSRDYR